MVNNSSLGVIGDQVRNCTKCTLCQTRTKAVPGEGSSNSKIVIIGEAPGKNEDLQGRPFVGQAGKLLDKMLNEIGLPRNEVFITNIVKCRPPENRDPFPHEVLACSPYLNAQLSLINPQVVILLGRHALERLLPSAGKISSAQGRAFRKDGVIYVPVYHPAAVLRNSGLMGAFRDSFSLVKELVTKGAMPRPKTN